MTEHPLERSCPERSGTSAQPETGSIPAPRHRPSPRLLCGCLAGTAALGGCSGLCASHGNSERGGRRRRRTRADRFPPLPPHWGCPGPDAAVAARRCPLRSAKHSTIRTAATATPGARSTHRAGDVPPGGVWDLQRGRGCRDDLQPGAVGCQHPPAPLWATLGEQSERGTSQQQPPVPRPMSLPPATLGPVPGAAWHWAGWDPMQSIPCPGTRAPALAPGGCGELPCWTLGPGTAAPSVKARRSTRGRAPRRGVAACPGQERRWAPQPARGDGVSGWAGWVLLATVRRARSVPGWCTVHTWQPAKRNYSCFILPRPFLVPAARVYKSCSCQPPLRGRGQLRRAAKGSR